MGNCSGGVPRNQDRVRLTNPQTPLEQTYLVVKTSDPDERDSQWVINKNTTVEQVLAAWPPRYRLLSVKEELDRGRTLLSYPIRNGDPVHVLPPLLSPSFKIELRILRGGVPTTTSLIVTVDVTVAEFKLQIPTDRIPADWQVLTFDSKVLLDDNKTLGSYGVRAGDTAPEGNTLPESTLPVYVVSRPLNRLFVKATGFEFPVNDIAKTTGVHEFKELLETRFGIPRNRQRLSHKGVRFADDKALTDYKMEQDDTLDLDFPSADVGGSMRLYIKERTGQSHAFDAPQGATAEELKLMITDRLDITAPEVRLTFAGTKLEDWPPLACYNIQCGSTLHLLRGEFRHATLSDHGIRSEATLQLRLPRC